MPKDHIEEYLLRVGGSGGVSGEQLREYRIRAGITQRRLGEMLGYEGRSGECTVQNWEYGKAPIPVKHFRKLSVILRVPLERFVP